LVLLCTLVQYISSIWLWAERLVCFTLGVRVKEQRRKPTLVTDAGQMWKGSLIFTVSSFIPTVKKWLLKSAWSCRKKEEILKAMALWIHHSHCGSCPGALSQATERQLMKIINAPHFKSLIIVRYCGFNYLLQAKLLFQGRGKKPLWP
jgi:hypothetical protein